MSLVDASSHSAGASSGASTVLNTTSAAEKLSSREVELNALSDEELVQAAAAELRRRGAHTIGFAESCTGGLLSATFAAVAGVSDVFLGSVVTYSNLVKEQMLRVSPSLLRTVGAVSTQVAVEMADGARRVIGSTWAIGVTGIAGPGGATPDKPLGTVCFAWVGPGFDRSERMQFEGSRVEIQKKSVRYALVVLVYQLEGAV